MSPIASSDPCYALSGIGNRIFPSCCAFVPRARFWSMRLPDCSSQVHAQPSSGSWPLFLAAIDTSIGCASLFLVLFGSPFLLPNWNRTLPLLADQVLDLATAIVCPTLYFLPSPTRNIHFRLWKEIKKVFDCGPKYCIFPRFGCEAPALRCQSGTCARCCSTGIDTWIQRHNRSKAH